LPLFWVGLRVLGFNRFNAWIISAPVRGKPPLAFDEIAAIGALVNSAAFHLLGPDSCLPRSMYLLWLLRRQGVMSDLRFGARLVRGQFQAHVWVEAVGQPVNDPKDITERFGVLNRPLPTKVFSSK